MKGKVSVKELLDMNDYSLPENETIKQAFTVLQVLTDWMEEKYDSVMYIPNITVSKHYLCLSIGEVVVWDSENNSPIDLTSECCKDEYKKHIDGMMEVFVPREE